MVVVEDRISSTDTLDRTATDKIQDQGYVVVRGLLDDAEDIRPVRDEYEDLLDSLATAWHGNGELSSTYADLPFEQRLAMVASEGVPYTDYFDICFTGKTGLMHRGPAVFNLLRSPRLLDGVEHFIGPEIYSNPIQHVRIKVPERLVPTENQNDMNSRTPWHQDASTVTADAEETQMLTVWLAITESTVENGCLVVIPESHKEEELSVHCRIEGGRLTGIPDQYLGENRQPVPMKPGDVLFMTNMTKHASLTNESDGIRFSFDLRYHPTGQATGRSWYPGFVARSRSRPETELRDFATWDRLWDEAYHALEAIDYNTPGTTHWKTGEQDPRCA